MKGNELRALPEYEDPPVNEVILDIQFAEISGYKTTDAAAIWGLFREKYEQVDEQQRLQPNFELFGGFPQHDMRGINFQQMPLGTRLWFKTKDDAHLIQFQPDRFILNWRRGGGDGDVYPRYENIKEEFKSRLGDLEKFVEYKFEQSLNITQAEIKYLNQIEVSAFKEATHLLRIGDIPENVEAINYNVMEHIYENDKPIGRFYREIGTGYSKLSQDNKIITLMLTYRGKPETDDIDAALNFLEKGHEKIVVHFDEITTDKAHKLWRKK